MKPDFLISDLSFKANKMSLNQAEHIQNSLIKSDSVDIFCHVSTDEDAFNSAKIMYEYLENNGVRPRIICSGARKNYGYDEKKYRIIQSEDINSGTEKSETALCVDFSTQDRINGKALKYLTEYGEDKIIGFDHHHPKKPVTNDFIFLEKSYDTAPVLEQPKNFYIDSSAKSAASIIIRFFQALGIEMSKTQLKSAYAGMLDDMSKYDFIKFSKAEGAVPTGKLKKDKNASEVFNFVDSKLDNADKQEVISHLDILSNLNLEESAFQKKLYDKIQLTDNGRAAYVIIPPDDEEWINIGGDNSVTSKILRDFRIRTLKHEKQDEFLDKDKLEKIKNVEAVMVFYPDYKSKRYRISMHSNKDYAEKIIEYNRNNLNKNLIAGGHPNRSGGSMAGLNKNECSLWVKNFLCAAENIEY